MNILVTGGGGFIGSHLVDSQLAQGHSVRTVDIHVERLAHTAGNPNLEIITGDLTEAGLIERLVDGIDIVYHLASAHLDVTLPDDYYRQTNVDASVRLLEAACRSGVQRVVHCSSVGVLGDIAELPAHEASECRPTNIYEKTKLEGERAVLEFANRTGFPVVVARPAWVYGPRCPRTHKLFRNIRKGRFPIFGDGRTLRHPIYIADAVRGLELCATAAGVTGQVYILAGEEPVTIDTLVKAIAELQGKRPPTLHLPVALGKAAGYGLQIAFKPLGIQPPFSRRSVDFFLKDNAYDISKARRELGFHPQVDLHTGLAHTLSHFN